MIIAGHRLVSSLLEQRQERNAISLLFNTYVSILCGGKRTRQGVKGYRETVSQKVGPVFKSLDEAKEEFHKL